MQNLLENRIVNGIAIQAMKKEHIGIISVIIDEHNIDIDMMEYFLHPYGYMFVFRHKRGFVLSTGFEKQDMEIKESGDEMSALTTIVFECAEECTKNRVNVL